VIEVEEEDDVPEDVKSELVEDDYDMAFEEEDI
jgi:hypothetical protein